MDVNGENQLPLYSLLKRSCPSTREGFQGKNRLHYEPVHVRDIRWNFEKFLIHPFSGTPLRRYDEATDPETMAEDIRSLLEEVGLRSRAHWNVYGALQSGA